MNLKQPIIYILYIVLVIIISCIVSFFVSDALTPKITYVKSSELIEGYTGMKQARLEYDKKSSAWKANIDTLEYDFQQSVNRYNQDFPRLSEKEKKERSNNLSIQKQSLMKYSEAINAKAQEEETKVTQGVLNQINSFVEEYGRKHRYTIILGTTSTGNILYADNGIDITQEILKALNESYKSTGVPEEK